MSEKKTPPETPIAKASQDHFGRPPDTGHVFGYVALAPASPPPPDWYDGTPKRCPGSGQPVFVSYCGESDSFGNKLYRAGCKHCGTTFPLGDLPEHTFIPVRAEDLTFRTGKYMLGIEPLSKVALVGATEPPPPDWWCRSCRARWTQGIAEGKFGIAMCEVCIAESKRRHCDGDHRAPRCADSQCHHRDPRAGDVKAPHIVVLIGPRWCPSSLNQAFVARSERGDIVLTRPIDVPFVEPADLQRKRIDLADEVFIINFAGQLEPGSEADIEYARQQGKIIRWLVKP